MGPVFSQPIQADYWYTCKQNNDVDKVNDGSERNVDCSHSTNNNNKSSGKAHWAELNTASALGSLTAPAPKVKVNPVAGI